MRKILVVEDNPEAQETAKKILECRGYQAVVHQTFDYDDTTLDGVDGVITDLYFNPFKGTWFDRHSQSSAYDSNPPVSGLLVVIDALKAGKPVVVCTSGDHHGESLAWIHDGFLNLRSLRAFGWDDRKNFESALDQLEKRIGLAD